MFESFVDQCRWPFIYRMPLRDNPEMMEDISHDQRSGQVKRHHHCLNPVEPAVDLEVAGLSARSSD